MTFNTPSCARRIWALILRQYYLLRRSTPRLLEMMYWPTFSILVWGFLSQYLNKEMTTSSLVASSILGGALLWEFLVRSQNAILVSFMEEMWSRNLGNLFVSPIPPSEYAMGLIVLSLLRTTIALTPAVILTFFFFDLWLPGLLGLSFFAFILMLAMTGWALCFAILSGLLRYGVGFEWFAWMASFLLSPVVGVYYPIDVLPKWLQIIAHILPPTYIFEGMRSILNQHQVRHDLLLTAFGLNLVYLTAGVLFFLYSFKKTRENNGLLQSGE